MRKPDIFMIGVMILAAFLFQAAILVIIFYFDIILEVFVFQAALPVEMIMLPLAGLASMLKVPFS